jgi:hypothetical protein
LNGINGSVSAGQEIIVNDQTVIVVVFERNQQIVINHVPIGASGHDDVFKADAGLKAKRVKTSDARIIISYDVSSITFSEDINVIAVAA